MTDPFQPGLLQRLPAPPRRVAVVRAARLGDFLCATPALRALRAALPGAAITFIGLPMVRDLAARCPHLDRFEEFPGFPGMAEQLFNARAAGIFLGRLQAEAFDLAVQLHGSGVCSNPFTLLLGARHTAGFVRPGDPAGRLDAALPWPAEGHEVRRLLALTTFLGAPPRGEAMDLMLRPEDRAEAANLLAGAEPPFFGLHPSAREATKRWAPERFAAAGTALIRRHGGTVVVVAGPAERPLAEAVARQVEGPCRNLAGRTTLGGLGAVIERLAVLVTNDSGPAHLAYALGTPTVTIFGGTDPARWGPPAAARHRVLAHRVACWPCDQPECPVGLLCLEAITAEQAAAAASAALHGRQPNRRPPFLPPAPGAGR